MQNRIGVIGVGMVLAAGMLTVAQAAVPLPGGTQVPGAVVRDDTGEIVGPVLGFDNRRPVVLLRNGSERALLNIEEDFTFSSPVSVFYDGANCTGSVVAIESFTKFGSKGFMEWQGRVYGIGAGNTLYRNSNTTPTTITVASRFISVNPPGSQCNDGGGSSGESEVFPAELVDDLDAVFAPPFTLE